MILILALIQTLIANPNSNSNFGHNANPVFNTGSVPSNISKISYTSFKAYIIFLCKFLL